MATADVRHRSGGEVKVTGQYLYMAEVDSSEAFSTPSLHRTLAGAERRVSEKLAKNGLVNPDTDVSDLGVMRAQGWDVESYTLGEGNTGSVLCGDCRHDEASFGIHLMEVKD